MRRRRGLVWVGAGTRPGRLFPRFLSWPNAQAHFSRIGLVGCWRWGGHCVSGNGWAVALSAPERNYVWSLFSLYSSVVCLEAEVHLRTIPPEQIMSPIL